MNEPRLVIGEPGSREKLLAIVDEMIRPPTHVYYSEKHNCEWYFRYLWRLWGIELAESLFEARHDFVSVQGPALFMDAAVFRSDLRSKRHLGVMLDERIFTHCDPTMNGVARSDITRPDWRCDLLDLVRHKLFIEAQSIASKA